MGENFRTCVFGGFEKKDVVAFIEQLSLQHQEEMKAAANDKALLKEALSRMEQERVQLCDKAMAYDTVKAESQHYQALAQELQEQLAALQAENEALREPAAEYGKIKEHIADIEINAHHRTEAFRADMIAKLRETICTQRQWCQQEKLRYETMNKELLTKLLDIRQALEEEDYEAFDAMQQSLDALEADLQQ